MLKTSPILTSAPGTPSGSVSFRHAPLRSSQELSRQPAPMRRRASSRSTSSSAPSVKSPVQTRLTRPATQPSPSALTSTTSSRDHDPQRNHDTRSPAVAVALQNVESRAAPPIMSPGALAKTLTETLSKVSSPTPAPAPALVSSMPVDKQSDTLATGKRRGSPEEISGQPVDDADPAGDASSSTRQDKRHRPDEAPPKLLPQKYELCPVDHLVELIAFMLAELITTNDALQMSNAALTRFHSRTAPGISVRDYLHRLARHATLTPPLLLAMVYYIDRLCAMYPDFTINTLTVHRFLITAATVAAKGLSDAFWNNTTYARVGGVRNAELRLLELELLYRVDWRIVPNPEVLVAYYRGLVERTPGYELQDDASSSEELSDNSEEQAAQEEE